jgi:hypothetical protein
MPRKRVGLIITPPGVFVDRHEKLAADFLAAKMGFDVTFLVPDRHKGAKTPDVEMNGLTWEIKSPKGKGSRTIENTIRQALRQSPNIVLDLRRMDGRIPTQRLVDKIELQFNMVKPVRHIIVITRQETAIDFKR